MILGKVINEKRFLSLPMAPYGVSRIEKQKQK